MTHKELYLLVSNLPNRQPKTLTVYEYGILDQLHKSNAVPETAKPHLSHILATYTVVDNIVKVDFVNKKKL